MQTYKEIAQEISDDAAAQSVASVWTQEPDRDVVDEQLVRDIATARDVLSKNAKLAALDELL